MGAAAVAAGLVVWRRRKRRPEVVLEEKVETSVQPQVLEAGKPNLTDRLAKTRGALLSRLSLLARSDSNLQAAEWAEVEEALLGGDVGIQTATLLLDKVRGRLNGNGGGSIKDLIREESAGLFDGLAHGLPALSLIPKPYVISIVGINGVGKTTTIGKLARYFTDQGKTLLLGAGDTFRAAAISQLKVWADRVNAQFVAGREGGDPGAVAFDAVTAAKARGIDIVLLDTAGRLHTKANLMEELKKVHRVVKKVLPEAPHEIWLVIDGTLGQNSVQQAKEFQKVLELTGVIVTKLDGTAKGGAILTIASELKLPIRFIGVGEAVEDLIPFEPKPFVDAILG